MIWPLRKYFRENQCYIFSKLTSGFFPKTLCSEIGKTTYILKTHTILVFRKVSKNISSPDKSGYQSLWSNGSGKNLPYDRCQN